MPTLLEQIQRDCVDTNVPVSALLRKVKLAASKLGVATVEDWVDKELDGYVGNVPEYRIISGTPAAWCPYTGQQPLLGAVAGISKKAVGESVAALEACLASGEKSFQISYPDHIGEELDKRNGVHARYYLSFDAAKLAAIVDRVRTLCLDWSMRLEKAGVVGSDFSFTEVDKHKAQATSMHIQIGSVQNFTGNLGSGNTSGAITSGLDPAAVSSLLGEIRQFSDALVKAGVDRDGLQAKSDALEAELRKQSPDSSVLRGILQDIRNAISGAAGNVIASGLLYKIGGLLGA